VSTSRMCRALLPALMVTVMNAACSSPQRTFKQDVDFIAQHQEVVVLGTRPDGPRVLVVPAYQGRVMTSSAAGDDGDSFGWINYELIASGKLQPHINPFGGEDRFWIGPEGGQFSVFFEPGEPFDFEHWQTPALIDSEPYAIARRDDQSVTFEHTGRLTNYSGTTFDFQIKRTIALLDEQSISRHLGCAPGDGVRVVAYESRNSITNTGSTPWTRDRGLLSIWILGMFKPSPHTTVVIPFEPGPEEQLGPVVNDRYFGKVPPERLVVRDGVLFFKGDGRYRSKIGIAPQRAKPILGSYNADDHVLTIVQYSLPAGVIDYVNSMWELQDQPYRGDVVNSYNDGPLADGSQLGPFYELETSSPAAALAPGETISHVHRTFHFQGDEQQLDQLARTLLGVSLEEIERAFED